MSTKRKQGCCSCCCLRVRPETDEDDNMYMEGSVVVTTVGDIPRSTNKLHPASRKEHVYQKKKTKCDRCLSCCKKVTTFFFSNIGLCAIVIGYSILGGFIFRKLEAENELIHKHSVISRRRHHVALLWNVTLKYNILWEVNWTISAEEILSSFQEEIFNATKMHGWDGKDTDSEQQWSFAGSLLYAITVITTIGYGHIAPKTPEGRLVTIFYALVGIPMTLLFLANMGSFLAIWFRLLYKQICRLCCFLCCPTKDKMKKKRSRLKPSEDQLLNPLQSAEQRIDKSESDPDSPVMVKTRTKVKEHKREHIRVPLYVSLFIIATYIFGGALLFSMWEDWDYLVGSYFCFITLSTIGFGDFVPGSLAYTDYSNNQKLIICCCYLLFGLSVIAMCFNLMQEEVRAKFRWLAIKIGFMDR